MQKAGDEKAGDLNAEGPLRGLLENGMKLERVMGIEPTLFAWEARVLPLNDTRNRQILIALRGSQTR